METTAMENNVSPLKIEEVDVLNFQELMLPNSIYSDQNVLDHALKQGVIILGNHEVSPNLLEEAYQDSQAFFNLNMDTKLKYAFKLNEQGEYGNTGYFPIGSEKAVLNENEDQKEFFHVGRSIYPFSYLNKYSKNHWPTEVDTLKNSFNSLFNQFEFIGNIVCTRILRALGYSKDYIEGILTTGNSILRSIKYPVTDMNGTCAGAHTGIQLIGIQPPASSKGLEINLQGNWFSPEGEGWRNKLIINIGEMLHHLSKAEGVRKGLELKPTLHRVVKTDVERYAIVFFYHPNHLKRIPFDGKIEIAGEVVKERLSELGL